MPRFPSAQAEGWNDRWGCTLHILHPLPKCLPGWAEGGSGVCRQRVTVPAPLSPLPTSLLALRTCRGTKAGTPAGCSTSALPLGWHQEPWCAAWGLVGWGPTTPPCSVCLCFVGGGDRPCLGVPAWRSRTRGAVCVHVCLWQYECSAEAWGRSCWQVAAVLGGCRGCRQQPVTVCVIHAGG